MYSAYIYFLIFFSTSPFLKHNSNYSLQSIEIPMYDVLQTVIELQGLSI